jgi:chorismate mutase
MDNSIFKFSNQIPFIISGPCSAETESQFLDTAKELAKIGKIDLLRAGIWKPRTKPGHFEGVGKEGLPWLKEAKSITGLPITVEVANAQHVELALEYNIDVLWIGARTTVNPFSVQEIADALKGVHIPILIKNPINPDIDLWVGAVERIEKAGIKQIGLIHRGFSAYGSSKYRNEPMWQIPIEMKRRFPNLPMICDPSHICGNRSMLQDVAQKSINLGFSGLMIESHIDPDNAWSDAAQQITPAQLSTMLSELIWRASSFENDISINSLAELRSFIDAKDDAIIELLGQRMKLADQIGILKKENNITILQTERWNEIMERLFDKAIQLGLSTDFIKKYFDAVHIESINHQNNIMNQP